MSTSTKSVSQQTTTQGWLVEMPASFAQALGVDEGSLALMHVKNGDIAVEVLPPPAPEFLAAVHETCEELKETLLELKRLGD